MRKPSTILCSVICALLLVGTAGCAGQQQPAGSGGTTKTAAVSGSDPSGEAPSGEEGFYDDAGNYYTYFDEDGDYQWDGFMDQEGQKYYYFDDDEDGTIDGYTDAQGNRFYYDAAKQTGASNKPPIAKVTGKTTTKSTAAVTKKPTGKAATTTKKGAAKTTAYVQTQSSAELYKAVKGTTVTIQSASEPSQLQLKQYKAFELAYGCKVKSHVMAWNDFKNQFLAMVSAGNVPDTCEVPDETFLKWISRGLLQPLDKYVNAADALWSDVIWDQYSWKGQHYGVNSSDGTGLYAIYNASLFKAKGVKTPLEYYNEGKWNFANFKKVCVAMTYDDVVGCGISWRYLLNLCNGNTAVKVDNAKGTVINALTEPSSINAVDTVVELRRGKYITFESGFDLFANARMAMYLERPWNVIGQFDLRNTTLKNAEIEICPLPKGPDAKEEYCPSVLDASAVPTKAQNPLGACAWYYYSAQYGKKHENDADVVANRRLTYTDEQYTFVQNYEKTHKRLNTFVYGVGNWYSDDWGYWSSMINDGLSVQAANDKFAGEFQAMIDTLDNV